jgi:hypothetical protein
LEIHFWFYQNNDLGSSQDGKTSNLVTLQDDTGANYLEIGLKSASAGTVLTPGVFISSETSTRVEGSL